MGKKREIKEGDVFYSLKVVENIGSKPYYGGNATFYLCECLKCGNTIEVPRPYLGKSIKDCGCGKSEPRKKIEIGSKFNHLEVIGIGKHVKGKGYYYICQCDCPKHTILEVRRDGLISGDTTSCGCVRDSLFRENVKKAYKKNFVNDTSIPKIAYDTLQKNNTSGCTGVYWHKRHSKWAARIIFQGKNYSLGYYNDKKQAIAARKSAENELHKDFFEWYEKNFPKEYKRMIENRSKTTIR